MLDDGRPSWENNLNWFVDDNTALAASPVSQHDAASGGRTRTMRATVTEAGITRVELGRADDLDGTGAVEIGLGVLASLGAASVLASVMLGPSARPVVTSGPLLCGLGLWLNQRDSQSSERTCAHRA